jgi:hypothetical protein
MRIRAAFFAAALAIGPSVLVAPALAEPPAAELERDAKKASQDARNALDQVSRDVKRVAQDVKKGQKTGVREPSKDLREKRDKLRQTRAERRKAMVKELRDKYGALLARPQVIEELRVHFHRVARLDYIEQLAEDLDQDKIANRAEKARDLENNRHELRMAALKAKGGEQ